MKEVSLLLIFCAFTHLISAQENFKSFPIYSIKTIDPTQIDYSDLTPLKKILKDKRIVLLGEQSHGEGATFLAKVRLIKFLHEQLEFNVLSFESGLYDNYKANELLNANSSSSPLKQGIYDIWSESKEFVPLLEYLEMQRKTSTPLLVSGFDCQADNLFKEDYLSDLKQLLKENQSLTESDFQNLEEVMEGDAEFVANNAADSVRFFTSAQKILKTFDALPSKETIHAKVMRQVLTSWLAMVQYEMDVMNDKEIKVQNPRDLQMSKNLIFLSTLYPNSKIICWGATYHFANQIQLHRGTDLTKTFAHRLDSLEKSHEPTDFGKLLAGAVPMGQLVKNHFGDNVYSLAFSSFEGNFGMLGFTPKPLKPIEPPANSIEKYLVDKNFDFAFVDYTKNRNAEYFYSSVLGNLPIEAAWPKIVDGLFFIKNSYPPSLPSIIGADVFPTIKPIDLLNKQKRLPTSIKRVIDKNTKVGVAYASVSLLGTSKGVACNSVGEFAFNWKSSPADKLIISSIGYVSDTLSILEFRKNKEFQLTPKAYELEALEVRAKTLSAKEILKKAEKNILSNYYQLPHQQEFFFRVKEYHDDSVTFNEEAATIVFNQDGYKPSSNIHRKLKGEILQFRNTTQNQEKDLWSGVGSLWLIFTHDVVLNKDNVLHRPAYYDLSLTGKTILENRLVYEITFDCKRPGAFTTGFGYPGPLSAKGKIFVDVANFAVLKFEILIYRKPYSSRKYPHLRYDLYGHQLIQTYKQHNGRYFLNYSKQVSFYKLLNSKTAKHFNYAHIKELLSTEIALGEKDISKKVNLTNIKSAKLIEDSTFWENHNWVIEDKPREIYKLLEKGKEE
jgi:erythromycin esterase-like protein